MNNKLRLYGMTICIVILCIAALFYTIQFSKNYSIEHSVLENDWIGMLSMWVIVLLSFVARRKLKNDLEQSKH